MVADLVLDPTPAAPADADHGGLTFIGNATVLLRLGSFTILTDPNFLHAGEHAYLGLGLRSKRLLDPAIEIDALPPLDLVVLSHHHGDHFDHVAAERLDKDLPIVTEPHSAGKLRSQGFRAAIALGTWEQQRVRRGDEEFVQVQGGRVPPGRGRGRSEHRGPLGRSGADVEVRPAPALTDGRERFQSTGSTPAAWRRARSA